MIGGDRRGAGWGGRMCAAEGGEKRGVEGGMGGGMGAMDGVLAPGAVVPLHEIEMR